MLHIERGKAIRSELVDVDAVWHVVLWLARPVATTDFAETVRTDARFLVVMVVTDEFATPVTAILAGRSLTDFTETGDAHVEQ